MIIPLVVEFGEMIVSKKCTECHTDLYTDLYTGKLENLKK